MGDGGHDVGQEFHEVAAFMNSHFPNCSAGAIAFDSQEELLWVGSESVSPLTSAYRSTHSRC